jgi:uncharacterized membrane protein
MKLKDRVKSYSFWVSLASAIFLILKLVGQKFGFSVDEGLFNDLFTSLCGILVILGIIVPPTGKSKQTASEVSSVNLSDTQNDCITSNSQTQTIQEQETDLCNKNNVQVETTETEPQSAEVITSFCVNNDENCNVIESSQIEQNNNNLSQTSENNTEFQLENQNFAENVSEFQQIQQTIADNNNCEIVDNNEIEITNELERLQSKFEGNYTKYIELLNKEIEKLSTTKTE